MLPVVLQANTNAEVPRFLLNLEQYGLLDAVLPFLLIFAVVFTVAKTSRVLGENKGVHMIVSLIMALLVVIPHLMGTYPEGRDVVNIINTALPNVSLILVLIVAALILVGIFVPTGKVPGGGFFAVLGVLAVVYIFGLSAAWWESMPLLSFLASPDVQAVLVIVIVFAVIVFLITADSPIDNLKRVRDLITGQR